MAKKMSKKQLAELTLQNETYQLFNVFNAILGEPKTPDYMEDNFGFCTGYYRALSDVARLLLQNKGVTWNNKPSTSTQPASPTPQPASAGTSTST